MKNKIKKDMVQAMKDKNIVARDVLRVVLGEIERTDDADVTKIVKKLIESIKLSGAELADIHDEIIVLERYLPQQMTEAEITFLATSYIAKNELNSPREMGKVMGYFKQNFSGTYDGKVLSGIVKELLS